MTHTESITKTVDMRSRGRHRGNRFLLFNKSVT